MEFPEYNECILCPRRCGARRNEGQRGYCGESSTLRIAWIGPHFGEEPPVSAARGSGTVFFCGCTLRCRFCQNHQISLEPSGSEYRLEEAVDEILAMVRAHAVHNVNFVTPDHYSPHVAQICRLLREAGVTIPFLANVSGYEGGGMLDLLASHFQIWLPDFKYSDRSLAKQLSNAADYPAVAIAAIEKMVMKNGFLQCDAEGVALKGVLVRHLILPGCVSNSCDALSTLFLEFGKDLPISLMSQYWPAQPLETPFDRSLRREEFYEVLDFASSLGFTQMFVQYPEENSEDKPFAPDFSMNTPFKGNIK